MNNFKQQLKNWKHKHQPAKKKVENELTERDLKELMGMNRPTYTRGRGGAMKQK
ncbi:hypothetical protein ACFFJY_07990 [Fictibacillus aquaticus]|uniref:hypothetical protein n=1 Tax=Fictibacillus aquaticus TaxID=2021314 RepID=UPI0013FD87F9|nr:hypothetical protein [Fictibacillus aquaticus]